MVERSKDAVTRHLVDSHFEVEPDIDLIVELVGPDNNGRDETIKLLEVNSSTTMDGIRPLHFGKDAEHGVLFPSIIVEVSPEEFALVESGGLALPDGWRLGRRFRRRADPQSVRP